MRLLLGVLLILQAVAVTPALAAGKEAAPKVPQSFLECVRAHEARLDDESLETKPAFGCTRAYFESLPGASGTTVDMNDAFVDALTAADAYMATLRPRLLKELKEQADGEDIDVAKELDGVIRAATAYQDALCGFEYDLFIGGTIRSIVGGSCKVEQTDALIGTLLGLPRLVG